MAARTPSATHTCPHKTSARANRRCALAKSCDGTAWCRFRVSASGPPPIHRRMAHTSSSAPVARPAAHPAPHGPPTPPRPPWRCRAAACRAPNGCRPHTCRPQLECRVWQHTTNSLRSRRCSRAPRSVRRVRTHHARGHSLSHTKSPNCAHWRRAHVCKCEAAAMWWGNRCAPRANV